MVSNSTHTQWLQKVCVLNYLRAQIIKQFLYLMRELFRFWGSVKLFEGAHRAVYESLGYLFPSVDKPSSHWSEQSRQGTLTEVCKGLFELYTDT